VAVQPHPVRVGVWDGERVWPHAAAYSTLDPHGGGWVGRARLDLGDDAALSVEDRWNGRGSALQLARSVWVEGDAPGAFLSAFPLPLIEPLDVFTAGRLRGWTEHPAVGTTDRPGRARRTRGPSPLLGFGPRDGGPLPVPNAAPEGPGGRGSPGPGLTGLEDVPFPFAGGPSGADEGRWPPRCSPLRDGFEERYEVTYLFAPGQPGQDADPSTGRWAGETPSCTGKTLNLGGVWVIPGGGLATKQGPSEQVAPGVKPPARLRGSSLREQSLEPQLPPARTWLPESEEMCTTSC